MDERTYTSLNHAHCAFHISHIPLCQNTRTTDALKMPKNSEINVHTTTFVISERYPHTCSARRFFFPHFSSLTKANVSKSNTMRPQLDREAYKNLVSWVISTPHTCICLRESGHSLVHSYLPVHTCFLHFNHAANNGQGMSSTPLS